MLAVRPEPQRFTWALNRLFMFLQTSNSAPFSPAQTEQTFVQVLSQWHRSLSVQLHFTSCVPTSVHLTVSLQLVIPLGRDIKVGWNPRPSFAPPGASVTCNHCCKTHTHTYTHTSLQHSARLDSESKYLCCASSRQRKAPHLSAVPPNHEIFRVGEREGVERMRVRWWKDWERERERLRAVALLVIIIVIKVLVVFRNVSWWYHVYEDTGLRYDKQWIPEIRVLQQHSYVTLVLHFSIKIIKNQWIYSTSQKYTIN